jgi:cysteine desulfurase/selenocysteine lyase
MDIKNLKQQFPFFTEQPELIYFDNASTTQKPKMVLDRLDTFLRQENANAGRGTYSLATRVTKEIENVREEVREFLNASDTSEIAFTSGATASLNIITLAWGFYNLRDGDEILFSSQDHKANVMPWKQLQAMLKKTGITIKIVPYNITKMGGPDYEDLIQKVNRKTRLITLAHIHNVFGSDADVLRIRKAVPPNVLISLDASQSISHIRVDVQELQVDFVSFSGHKMFALNGSGVLWVNQRVHHELHSVFVGGMGEGSNKKNKLSMAELFEAGTLNIPAIMTLGAAIKFINSITIAAMHTYISDLTQYLLTELKTVPRINFLPGAFYWACICGFGIISFTIEGIPANEVGFLLNEYNIAVRTGNHCLSSDESEDSIRVSLHVYNTKEEIHRFITALKEIANG